MKKINPIFRLFFGLIILTIPIFNQLHFSLIDHSTTQQNHQEIVAHQCQHFTFYTTFLDSHDEPNFCIIIDKNYPNEIHSKLNLSVDFEKFTTIFLRGPPNNHLI